MYESLVDIEAFIGRAESHELEFKRGDLLDSLARQDVKDELLRDVSAFANSGGGVIVYGIEEKRKRNGTVVADSIYSVKESSVTELRLREIIQAGLEPRFSDFKIFIVDATDGGRIFTIVIEKAHTAHQCKSDCKYYHRTGSQKIAMRDYEIRDVMSRRSSPNVRVECLFHQEERQPAQHVYILQLYLTNYGRRTAKLWTLNIRAPRSIATLKADRANGTIVRQFDSETHRVFEYSSERAPRELRTWLLPGQWLTVGSVNFYPVIQLTVTAGIYDLPDARIFANLWVDDCDMIEIEVPLSKWCRF